MAPKIVVGETRGYVTTARGGGGRVYKIRTSSYIGEDACDVTVATPYGVFRIGGDTFPSLSSALAAAQDLEDMLWALEQHQVARL